MDPSVSPLAVPEEEAVVETQGVAPSVAADPLPLIRAGRFDQVQMQPERTYIPDSTNAIEAKRSMLFAEFPAWEENIRNAEAKGHSLDDIWRELSYREMTERFVEGKGQFDLDVEYGRTPETKAQTLKGQRLKEQGVYFDALKGSMPRQEIQELLHVAELTGLSPGTLHANPELFKHAQKEAGKVMEGVAWIGEAARRMYDGWQGGRVSKRVFETARTLERMEKATPEPEAIYDYYGSFLTYETQEQANARHAKIVENARREYAALKDKVEWFDRLADSRERVRPPDSMVGALLIVMAENSGFSIAAGGISGAARVVGGIGGGIAGSAVPGVGTAAGAVTGSTTLGVLASLFNTDTEAKMEAGGILMDKLYRYRAQGMSFDEAFDRGLNETGQAMKEVYRNNLAWLGATNIIGDQLTFGGSTFARRSLKGMGKAAVAKELGRRALPFAADSLMEGVEEVGQYVITALATGEEIDPDIAMESFAMGSAQALLHAGAGRAIIRSGSTIYNKLRGAGADTTSVETLIDTVQKVESGEMTADEAAPIVQKMAVEVAKTSTASINADTPQAAKAREIIGTLEDRLVEATGRDRQEARDWATVAGSFAFRLSEATGIDIERFADFGMQTVAYEEWAAGNPDAGVLEQDAMYKNPAGSISEFRQNVLSGKSGKSFFEFADQNGARIEIASDDLIHANREHELSDTQWQAVMDGIANIEAAYLVEGEKGKYDGQTVGVKIDTPLGKAGVVLEMTKGGRTFLKSTFFSTDNNLDRWLQQQRKGRTPRALETDKSATAISTGRPSSIQSIQEALGIVNQSGEGSADIYNQSSAELTRENLLAQFKTPTLEEFIAARDRSTRPMFLTPYTAEQLREMGAKPYLTDDGVGFALTADGDMIGVFNNSERRGAAVEAVILAIAEGAKTCDCIGRYLTEHYPRFGFVESGRVKWDDEQAPAGWDYETGGRPDVVFFEYPGNLSRRPADVARRFEASRSGEVAGGVVQSGGNSRDDTATGGQIRIGGDLGESQTKSGSTGTDADVLNNNNQNEGRPQEGGSFSMPNANIQFAPDSWRSMISFFENANASSSFHELAHHMMRILADVRGMEGLDAGFASSIDAAFGEMGVTMDEFRTDAGKRRAAQEKFARTWEAYMATGKAPTRTLQDAFRRVRKLLLAVYDDIKARLGVEVSPEMTSFFDQLLATPEEMDAEHRANTSVGEVAEQERMVRYAIRERKAEVSQEPSTASINADTPQAAKAREIIGTLEDSLVEATGRDRQEARDWATVVGSFAFRLSEATGIDIERFADFGMQAVAYGEWAAGRSSNTSEPAYEQSETPNGLSYSDILNSDERAWQGNVDKVFATNADGKDAIDSRRNIRVMTTPLAFKLAGAKVLPVFMNAGKLREINQPKSPSNPEAHNMSLSVLKQLPSALANPVAIFKSRTESNSIVVMTELKDVYGATVLGAIHMDVHQDSYQINKLANAYGKESGRIPNNRWYLDDMTGKGLLYMDTEKTSQWLNRARLQLPAGTTIEKLSNSVPTQGDLVNMRDTYDGYYQSEGREIFNQPANADVDRSARVNVIQLNAEMPSVPSCKMKAQFTPDMMSSIVGEFEDGKVVNAHTGVGFSLSKSGLDHIINTARNADGIPGSILYHAIPQLDTLAREAYRVETHGDRKAKDNRTTGTHLKNVHRYLVPVDLNGERHVLMLTAKEFAFGRAEIDEVSLYDQKYAKKLSDHPSQGKGGASAMATGTVGNSDNTVIVGEMIAGVKDAFGEEYAQEQARNPNANIQFNPKLTRENLLAQFKTPTLEEFIAARDRSTRPMFLTPYTAEQLREKGANPYLTDDEVGFALTSDGDMIGVFNNSGRRGAAVEAVILAIAEGAETCDCIGKHLENYYPRFGFVEKERMTWDDEQAPAGWDYETGGRPDVVFFEYPENFSRRPTDVARRFSVARSGEISGGAIQPGRDSSVDAEDGGQIRIGGGLGGSQTKSSSTGTDADVLNNNNQNEGRPQEGGSFSMPNANIQLNPKTTREGLLAQFKTPTLEEFVAARDRSTRPMFLTPYTAEQLQEMGAKPYLTDDGVGFALTSDGDMIGVFNNSERRGAAVEAVILAIAEGAKTCDCIGNILENYYSDFGFVEKERMAWDDEQAPAGWDYETGGRPDVVVFEYPENLSRRPADITRRFELARNKRVSGGMDASEGNSRQNTGNDQQTPGRREMALGESQSNAGSTGTDAVVLNNNNQDEGRPQEGGSFSMPNANIQFAPDSWRSMISFFENANASSSFHELAHHMMRILADVRGMEGLDAGFASSIDAAFGEMGVTMDEFRNDADKRRAAQEKFARTWEAYMATGKAPTRTLQDAFRRVRKCGNCCLPCMTTSKRVWAWKYRRR